MNSKISPLLLTGGMLFCSLLHGVDIKKITARSSEKGNPAEHAFDGHSGTRWADKGRGTWIQCELSESVNISKVGIGFARGERDYAFEVTTSMDGKKWSAPNKFQSKKIGDKVQEYKIPEKTSQFLRVTVFGSNANDWANIHTIYIPGVSKVKVKVESKTVEGFVIKQWARDEKLKGSVAISLDDQGRAYVARATRRKQSSLDIRHHQGWVKDDLSFTTIEDRRAYYKKNFNNQPDLKWLPDRNADGKRDWRDLTVQEDNVHQVADIDGDGIAEKVTTIDKYHTEVTGIAAGVLAVDSEVFVAVEPDIFRYEDADKDGVPEKKSLVSTGYSLHIGQGGHNMSGMALGPDGRVYWAVADKGHHVQTKEGKTYHMPNSGGVFRCEMDGRHVERFSSGERNAQELAFDAHGNLFSMDNDGDYPGEKERGLYITEGSMHGWRLNWQWLRKQDFVKISGTKPYNPWMDEKMFLPDHETFPAYLTPTIGNFGPGPCGFTANPGTALSPDFADCFFMTNNKSEVRVFKFFPKGASFQFEEQKAIKGGISNTGLAIGPDGALYASSWNGAIYQFDVIPENHNLRRTETRRILASKGSEQDMNTLAKWLNHADQRVRMKGQFELVRRKDGGWKTLSDNLKSGTLLGKLHAIWGVGMIARLHDAEALSELAPAWKDAEPEVRAQAAKVVGELGTRSPLFKNELISSLDDPNPRVQFFAAIALGNKKNDDASPNLVQFLEVAGAKDPYLHHAGVMGLTGSHSSQELTKLANHSSKSVRLGAIVALRRQKAPEIRAFLEDKDELVLLEAARAIHDDQSIPEALSDLAYLMAENRPDYKNEALMRRVINAALRGNSLSDLNLLTNYLLTGKGNENLRRLALASILWWADPPVLDPVEGRYRKHAPRDVTAVHEAVKQLHSVLAKEKALVEVMLKGVEVLGHSEWLPNWSDQFATLEPKLQITYLKALDKTSHPNLGPVVKVALKSKDKKVAETARGLASKVKISVLDELLAIINDPNASGRGKAVEQLAELNTGDANKEFWRLVGEYHKARVAKDIRLEVWKAAKKRGTELLATDDRMTHGGDPKRGEALIVQYQCIQCHQIGKKKLVVNAQTATIGPDLSNIGKQRDRQHLVTSLLNPSASITEGFGTANIQLKSGKELTAVLTSQTEKTWHLKLPDGTSQQLPTKYIASHTLISVMPNYSQVIPPESIRDIVEFLASLH